MNHRLALFTLLVSVVVPSAHADAAATLSREDETPWATDLPDALELSTDRRAPILVDLWAVWCEPCRVMEETTYRDPRVLEAMREFVTLKMNADEEELFVVRHEAETLPTTMFLDHRGREIARRVGYLSATDLLAALRLVRDGYPSYLDNADRTDEPDALNATASYLVEVGNPATAAKLLRRSLKLVKDDPVRTELTKLELGRALAAEGRHSAAVRQLEKIADSAKSDEVRGRALAELVRVERARGREDRADELSRRLDTEIP
jgi:thioredoxin-like negative regulator of GroEL